MFYEVMSFLFPKRCREIPAVNGGVLLQQIRITKTAYMHHFVQPEPAGKFHLHRWTKMRSFILTGHYIEERLYADRSTKKIRHRFLQTFAMGREAIHRIDYWSPGCWTLFFYSDDDLGWGYVDGETFEYTPWDEYIPEKFWTESI